MDYAKLNNSLKSMIGYNVNLTNLTNYIDTTTYLTDVTLDYINNEYAIFESFMLNYIRNNPLTKDIAVLNFHLVTIEENFYIDMITYSKFVPNTTSWAASPLNTVRDEGTKNILSKLKPSSENANIAFISMTLIIAFINTFYMRYKKELTKDRSIFGLYPSLKLVIQFEDEDIHVVKNV